MVVIDENPPNMPTPIVTYTLILLNVLIFFIGVGWPQLLLPGATSYSDVINGLGMVPAYVLQGERLYTLFTSMFLHAGLMHLLGNMLYLFVFGDNVEAALGRGRYLLLYLASGLGATVFHLGMMSLLPPSQVASVYYYTGTAPWLVPAIGASGAISGILGAYLLMFPGTELHVLWFVGPVPVPLRLPAGVYILIWFVFQLLYAIASLGTALMSGVAFWAHIGGFLTGLLLAPLLVKRERLAAMYAALPY